MKKIAIPEIVRPSIEEVIGVHVLDSPIGDLHEFREDTVEVDREGLRKRMAALDAARARHADLVADVDAGLLPPAEAEEFARAALDDARATLVDVVEVSKGTIDVAKIEAGARVIAALEELLVEAKHGRAEVEAAAHVAACASVYAPADDAPVKVIDPVAQEELRAAAVRLLRLKAREVSERLEGVVDSDTEADEAAIDELEAAIRRRDFLESGDPLPAADLAILKEEVLSYAAAIEAEDIDWSDPHKVAERAQQLVAVADLGTVRP